MRRLSSLFFYIGFLFLLLNFSFFSPKAFAADFLFDYDVFYNISDTGKTHVKQDIVLTNIVTEAYARNYSLTIASEDLTNVTARDAIGIIDPVVEKNDGQTKITLPFNAKIVGVNKELAFSLEYDTEDIASKNGTIWEIIVPGIVKSDEVRSYTINLSVPKSFGKANYFAPAPNNQGKWTMAEHDGKGISAAFGDRQQFVFELNYHLENKQNGIKFQEITLPPDTAYQNVSINQIAPTPLSVHVDDDGNWIAKYRVDKGEKLDISLKGTASVFAKPNTTSIHLSDGQKALYTQSLLYWEQTPSIVDIAKKLTTPEAIYNYVIDYLQYDYSRVTEGIKRLGAETAFSSPEQAVCMEFSDLFVALARSAGIPARVHHGYAFTANPRLQPLSLSSDVLHAWPEYYDEQKKQWILIDPTWGDTTHGIDYFNKFDFNHLTFAILGTKSDYPYPAGSYRSQRHEKDVFVGIDDSLIEIPTPNIQVSLNKTSIFAALPTLAMLTIKNTGGVAFYPKTLTSLNRYVKVDVKNLKTVPPFGSIEVPIKFHYPIGSRIETQTIRFALNDEEYAFDITIKSLIFTYLPIVMGIMVVIGILGVTKKVYGKRLAKK